MRTKRSDDLASGRARRDWDWGDQICNIDSRDVEKACSVVKLMGRKCIGNKFAGDQKEPYLLRK
jgi:hypothetical protein